MPLILSIALTHVAGRLRQSVVSVLGVTLGVGFSIAMAALMEGSQHDFIATLVDAIPHVEVTDDQRDPPPPPAATRFDAVNVIGARPDDDTRGLRNPVRLRAMLASWLPGRMAASLNGQAVLRYGGKDVAISLTGVDPAAHLKISTIAEDMRAGSFLDLAANLNGLIIGDGVADKLGAGLGDTVAVSASSGAVRRLKVIGLYHTGVTQADDATGYTVLKTAQVLFSRPNAINRLSIRLDDVNAARAIAARVERMTGYRATSWQEANEGLMEVLVVRNIIMYTVVGAILLVAGFGIFTIVSTIVHEKSRDIAILKSLGFEQSDIRRIFLAEGLLIGLVGSVLGSGLGYALSLTLGSLTFEVKTEIELTSLPLYYSPVHYLIACAFALFSAGVAGYLPARRAARLNPVDIIRGAA
ncbi:ABC transporter permease [Stappia indica]|uniref:ABC transporter permease n=1 Tax=Stappia indica TaxID=538381 RepID=UPI001CD20EFD|nr:ABC transporter permease [Stappia indica]MCA1297724.1 ABC transporter permease [Stappia indica]